MCGRFALGIPRKLVEERLAPGLPEEYRERFNIAPSTRIPVLGPEGWSMVPWGVAAPPSKSAPARLVINARSESVFERPMFQQGIRSGRCLVPAQAFYEWQKGSKGRTPHAFMIPGEPLFTMAGILIPHGADSAAVILTREAEGAVAEIHNRMPVVVAPRERGDWTGPETSGDTLRSLLGSRSGPRFQGRPVSTLVNSPANDSPDCLAPAQRQASLPGL